MNKHRFFQELSKRTGFTQKALLDIFRNAYDIVCEELNNGGSVTFVGFGSFVTRRTGEKRYITPQGEVKVTAPRVNPVFKVGKEFKDRVK